MAGGRAPRWPRPGPGRCRPIRTAMIRHTRECRQRGNSFVADPRQQLARMGGWRFACSSMVPPTCSPTNTKPRSPSRRPVVLAGGPIGWEPRVTTLGRRARWSNPAPHGPGPGPARRGKVDPRGGGRFPRGLPRRRRLGPVGHPVRPGRCDARDHVIETVGTQGVRPGPRALHRPLCGGVRRDAAADVASHLRVITA